MATLLFQYSLAATATLLLAGQIATAHPGSGIFVKQDGSLIFIDTGQGIWRYTSPDKPVELISDVAMHWLAIDPTGAFADAPDKFGEWFGRITRRGERPALITCSDFPCSIGPDGNLYFPFMHGLTIKRRTPTGEETIVTRPTDFGYDDKHAVGVNGITCATDGTIYIVLLDDLHQSQASADHWLYAINTGKTNTNPVRLIKKNFIPSDQIISQGERHHESIPQYCRGLAVDDSGNVYISATGNRCVVRVTPDGQSTIVLRCEKPWSPTAVAVHRDSLYVLEYDDETPTKGRNWPPRVRRLGPNGRVDELVTIKR
jgi:DNA-binding beta-propeller fold protein YncE